MSEYTAGCFGETEDGACHIYHCGFPRLTLYARVNEHGAQIEPDEQVQTEANRIAAVLTADQGEIMG
ncbi:MAG: hypothetical protein GY938_30785 [Ketobacter sp.]|nr:hypothetical protein [Ketobacter sp.]